MCEVIPVGEWQFAAFKEKLHQGITIRNFVLRNSATDYKTLDKGVM
jgi:hypothetical protein